MSQSPIQKQVEPMSKARTWGEDPLGDAAAFRAYGYNMMNYISSVNTRLNTSRAPGSEERPGFLLENLPREGPNTGKEWDFMLKEFEEKIEPGSINTQSPYYYASFPTMMGLPALYGDILAQSFNVPAFNWSCSPACTELEIIMLDWIAKALGLPEKYLSKNGGSVIQNSATESALVAMLAAKKRKLDALEEEFKSSMTDCGTSKSFNRAEASRDLTFYASAHTFPYIAKACRVIGQDIKLIPTVFNREEDNYEIDLKVLEETIQEDQASGKQPAFVMATFGTEVSLGNDPLVQVGKLAHSYDMWYHIDAAYAGLSSFLPEMRSMLEGIDLAHSLSFEGNKWMPGLFNSTFMYFESPKHAIESLNHSALYVENNKGADVIDYKDYEINLGRKFKSLKVWFMFKSYGLEGIQRIIRKHIELGKLLAGLISADQRFCLKFAPKFGAVFFALKNNGDGDLVRLVENLNDSGRMMVSTTKIGDEKFIRLVLASQYCTEQTVRHTWDMICSTYEQILSDRQ